MHVCVRDTCCLFPHAHGGHQQVVCVGEIDTQGGFDWLLCFPCFSSLTISVDFLSFPEQCPLMQSKPLSVTTEVASIHPPSPPPACMQGVSQPDRQTDRQTYDGWMDGCVCVSMFWYRCFGIARKGVKSTRVKVVQVSNRAFSASQESLC